MGKNIMDTQPQSEPVSYTALYADGHFDRVHLTELVNKGGAAGKIYRVEEHPKLVAKIFHNKNKSAVNRKKLEAMLLNRPNFPPAIKDGVEYVQIAWPEAILDDENGFCVGYLMPLIDMSKAVSLDHLMQKAIRKKLNLPEKYSYRLFAAYNVSSMVAALHSCGHYIVDLKPSNVSVYKDSMMVAMVDCDGFSIKGERNNRYPAEFVSEEYIYPEGMEQSCDEMGEEQDKFALAVMIFKLLNNGIHPFSGVPRKNDGVMLTIQNRIEQYRYAYGLWPDTYQAPHPYSIHEYFDKTTLELFERAFTKGANRPSAQEWQNHLHNLLHNLKICKKNPDHAYFTAKGCGLCAAEERFKGNMSSIKKQKETPQMLRGMEISSISVENLQKNKAEKISEDAKIKRISFALLGLYLIFFGSFYLLLDIIKDFVIRLGLGLQAIFITLTMYFINYFLNKYKTKFPIFQNRSIVLMLQVYAFICILIALVFINEIPTDVFKPVL